MDAKLTAELKRIEQDFRKKLLESEKYDIDEKTNLAQNLAQVALEKTRTDFFGKKSHLQKVLHKIGNAKPQERAEQGVAINLLKEKMLLEFEKTREKVEKQIREQKLQKEKIDTSMPERTHKIGALHPTAQVIEEAIAIFAEMGFVCAEGPDVEDDFHNFVALNFPPEHPARQMHDTFYLQAGKKECVDEKLLEKWLLRTHTSPVQVRTMLQGKLPIRVIAPGRCYRSDSDQTHTPMFHQIEGLVIDQSSHFGHLKTCLSDFVRAFFENENVPIRFRPSYFPFTEPSAEMDIACRREDGKINILTSKDEEKLEWMEILGCGMVHPNVLKACKIEPEKYQGFAFGMGVERIAMLKYAIADLRTFFDGDSAWLQHYGFSPLDAPALARGLRAQNF